MRVALIAVLLFAFSLAGFYFFPGHTYLQSDTQIYIPIFERIEHPELYPRDFLLNAAHVGLTIYDETAIGLRKLTGGTFESVLAGEQIVFRALGLWGVFLIATSLGLGDAAALLVAACYGLGATIVGPAVLSVEYEPVPRGFAVAFVLLASGLLLQGRRGWACAAASVGFLYHSPATIPFWILFGIVLLRERGRWHALWPLALAMAILAGTFAAQHGVPRSQPFFSVFDPEWEQVVRMRTTYDFIGQWADGTVKAFVVYGVIALAALWRIWKVTTPTHRVVMAGFPIVGVLSIGVSMVLLDHWKWALMGQVQPARAVLFTVVFAQINCALASVNAVRGSRHRWWEALLWFIPVFVPAVNPQVANGITSAQVATVLLLATVAVGFVMIEKVQWLAAPAVLALASWAIPNYAHAINYRPLHSTELDQLSDWARTQTPVESMFVFPASKQNLDQGVFRVKALRSLYVDWKSGGQANYFRDFALEWQRRWAELDSGKSTVDDWRGRGVDYVVYEGPRVEGLGDPKFDDGKYRAYKIDKRL